MSWCRICKDSQTLRDWREHWNAAAEIGKVE